MQMEEANAPCPFCANHCKRTIVRFSNGNSWVTNNRCERGEILGDPKDASVRQQLADAKKKLEYAPDELEKKEPGLEERFAKIDAILDAMEDENVTLDRSFALYKEGLEQIKAAGQSLDTIEKAMLVLNQDGKLEEF